MSKNSLAPSVTVVIFRRVKPGCEKAFEKFISGITASAMAFEGHLGTNVFRPSDRSDNEYKIIFKFARASDLQVLFVCDYMRRRTIKRSSVRRV